MFVLLTAGRRMMLTQCTIDVHARVTVPQTDVNADETMHRDGGSEFHTQISVSQGMFADVSVISDLSFFERFVRAGAVIDVINFLRVHSSLRIDDLGDVQFIATHVAATVAALHHARVSRSDEAA